MTGKLYSAFQKHPQRDPQLQMGENFQIWQNGGQQKFEILLNHITFYI